MEFFKKIFYRFSEVYKHKNLIFELSKRDFLARYKGSILGFLWAFIYPLIMLFVYSFIFVYIFHNKWIDNGVVYDPTTYTLMIFCGLIPFYIFSETLNRCTVALYTNPNYVKKVAIPVEVLPISIGISVFVNQMFAMLLLIIGKLVFMNTSSLSLFLLPVILIPILVLSIAFGVLFSAIGVFFRDFAHTVALLLNVLFYMSPIFYATSMVPEKISVYVKMNPLSIIIDMWREVIIKGNFINIGEYTIILLSCLIIFLICYSLFCYMRKGFADVV